MARPRQINPRELPAPFVLVFEGEGAGSYIYTKFEELWQTLRSPEVGLVPDMTEVQLWELLEDADNWYFDEADRPHYFRTELGETSTLYIYVGVQQGGAFQAQVAGAKKPTTGVGTVKLMLQPGALERLIGDDTELKVQLTHAALEQFTHSHIKAILNDEVYRKTIAKEREFVRLELDRLLAAMKRYNADETITQEYAFYFKETIRNKVEVLVDQLLNDRVVELVNKRMESLSRTIDYRIEVLLKDGITKRVKDALDTAMQRVRESL